MRSCKNKNDESSDEENSEESNEEESNEEESDEEESDEDLKSQLELLIKKGVSSTEAAKTIAEKSRKSKRYLYDLIHRKA